MQDAVYSHNRSHYDQKREEEGDSKNDKIPRKLTFKEIMDEELAKKLQEEFEHEAADLTEPTQEELDYIFALSLAQEADHNETANLITSNPNEVNDLLSEDYLLAASLQEQWQQQEQEELLAQQHRHSGSNVHVAYNPAYSAANHISYEYTEAANEEEEDDEDEDDEYSDDDYVNSDVLPQTTSSNNSSNTTQETNDKEARKPGGRQSKDVMVTEELVTKHDRLIFGVKHNQVLESQMSINSGNMKEFVLSNPVFNELNQHAASTETRRIRRHGKEDRETREGVMDTQTRLILFRMINGELFQEVAGIISTGKEANVYRAVKLDSETPSFYAVKIYKTTLNEFKNRDEYIKDDYRFRYKCNKQNPRKFIAVWAEKEDENLRRLQNYGIRCPVVIERKKHVLVMSFIGKGEQAAPQLKQVQLAPERAFAMYVECVTLIRDLFHKANLVHGDLSEYNLLYHQRHLVVIDVAQAVEHEHPNALYFLQRDCANMTRFFRKLGLSGIMSIRELFSFVTDVTINASNEELYLSTMLERCAERLELTDQEKQEEEIFMSSFIPRHLDQIVDPVSEFERNKTGEEAYHHPLTGLRGDLQRAEVPAILEDQLLTTEDDSDNEEEDSNQELSSTSSNNNWVDKVKPTKEQLKAQRKQAKKDFKNKQRTHRQNRHQQAEPGSYLKVNPHNEASTSSTDIDAPVHT